jgi:hypothetical protein
LGAGSYSITCANKDTGKVLPTGTFTVKARAEAGPTDCKGSNSKTATITVVGCCSDGDSAYADGTGKSVSDGSLFGKSTCFNENICGTSSNWGWRNEFGGEGTGKFEIYAGGSASGVGCTNRKKMVGTITLSCANEGSDARVLAYQPDQKLFNSGSAWDLSMLEHHLYVGCKDWADLKASTTDETGKLVFTSTPSPLRSPLCNPPSYNAPKSSLSTATDAYTSVTGGTFTCGGSDADKKLIGATKGRCGGNCYSTLVPRPATGVLAAASVGVGMKVPGCNCADVYWVYHQSDKSSVQYIYQPTNGLCAK